MNVSAPQRRHSETIFADTTATGAHVRSKDIGTRFESAVVGYLRPNGFPHAERRALAGSLDKGDVTGVPGVVFECKGGDVAKRASDTQIAAWMTETDTERRNAGADIGILVMARAGVGASRAGLNWAVIDARYVLGPQFAARQLRLHLSTAVIWLRGNGYGEPLSFEWSTSKRPTAAPEAVVSVVEAGQ